MQAGKGETKMNKNEIELHNIKAKQRDYAMFRSWSGIACIADKEITDRNATIPLSTLTRLCDDFLWKPLYCNNLEGHGDWSYQYVWGIITVSKMVGPELHLGGKLFLRPF